MADEALHRVTMETVASMDCPVERTACPGSHSLTKAAREPVWTLSHPAGTSKSTRVIHVDARQPLATRRARRDSRATTDEVAEVRCWRSFPGVRSSSSGALLPFRNA